MVVTQDPPRPVELTQQVARLAELDGELVERMRAEALGAGTRGVLAYNEFQSGGWWTASLMNHSESGDPRDVVIGDGRPRATSLLAQMPVTADWLRGLGLDLMYVRLARLSGHSYLWEHRDYAELQAVPRHRLHVPLSTNTSSVLVTQGAQVHMACGALWRLTPTYAHGVRNVTGPDRLHLIADVYADDAYQDLASAPCLREEDVRTLPAMSQEERGRVLARAEQMADLGFAAAAEQVLLRCFYDWALPEGGAYDLIAELHERRGDAAGAQRWRDNKTHLLAR
ncbi:aspartyl/asparaginyl beta-hydroxylase domain-containing protein [Streptomyces sp. NPDC007025]|uniref:aspartyl/asparaginyl beta-hydroxylase domain-containing protein n=1 Tax=Streptomyces sp. NPDC007025 TaxID=3364771 RepID=UPI003679604C